MQDASESRSPADPHGCAEGKGGANPNEEGVLGGVPLEVGSRA